MQRKYVKETPSARDIKNFYASFKTWILARYPTTGEPSEEEWKEIVTEDEQSYHPQDVEDALDNELEQSNPADLGMQNDPSFDPVYYDIHS